MEASHKRERLVNMAVREYVKAKIAWFSLWSLGMGHRAVAGYGSLPAHTPRHGETDPASYVWLAGIRGGAPYRWGLGVSASPRLTRCVIG